MAAYKVGRCRSRGAAAALQRSTAARRPAAKTTGSVTCWQRLDEHGRTLRRDPAPRSKYKFTPSGAPRSMKVSTIASPWRYDVAADYALQSAHLRRPAIYRYASQAGLSI